MPEQDVHTAVSAAYAQLEKDKKESADRDRASYDAKSLERNRVASAEEAQKKYDAEQEAYQRMLADAPRTRVQAVITSLTARHIGEDVHTAVRAAVLALARVVLEGTPPLPQAPIRANTPPPPGPDYIPAERIPAPPATDQPPNMWRNQSG
jgi:hypothetical protein